MDLSLVRIQDFLKDFYITLQDTLVQKFRTWHVQKSQNKFHS